MPDPRLVPTSFYCDSCEREREIELRYDRGVCACCAIQVALDNGEFARARRLADDFDQPCCAVCGEALSADRACQLCVESADDAEAA